jgi:hypothetical protein
MLMELNLSYCYHRATCQLPPAQHKVVFLCAISRPPSILQNLSPTNMFIRLQFRSLTSNLTATTIYPPVYPLILNHGFAFDIDVFVCYCRIVRVWRRCTLLLWGP